VVNLSSIAHRTGFIQFSDLQGERLYSPWKAYNQSKLAMLMFALELQRRSDAAGWNLMSNAAHPGMGPYRFVRERAGLRTAGVCQPSLLRRCSVSPLKAARCRHCTLRPLRKPKAADIMVPMASMS